jgi:signal transduction histidine kinase/CheY-like chemotaxis protein
MKIWPDLSIAQRLAVGFGLFFIIVAAMLAVFFSWHVASAREQTMYSERIAPLQERIAALERSTLRTAIALRSVLLDPGAERQQAFATNVMDVRSRLDELARSAMEPDGRSAYLQIEAATSEYLAQARSLAERRAAIALPADAEVAVGRLRERLLESTGAFDELQERKAAEALAQIALLRERTSQGMIVMAVMAAVVLTTWSLLIARAVSRPAQALARTADSLRSGNWKPALDLAPAQAQEGSARPRDEMRRLSAAIGSAAVALERREQRLRADGLLARAVASTLLRDELADRALQAISTHLGPIVGIVYWANEAQTLVPVGQYATAPGVAPLAIGDGLPGQAAREREAIFIDHVPPSDEFRVKLGYDAAPPSAAAALPLIVRDSLHGVLLIGSLGPLTDEAREFLSASARQLGIGFENVASYEAIQSLLAEVRESNDKIQAQNEELQLQNEEIQAQSEEIQAQSEELQAQHEEMQAQNEELIQQSAELRRHAAELAGADERKNRFLGVLAHELRNPMAPITNSLLILKRSEPGSVSAQRAQTIIERQTKHLVRLIDDLLDVTRISEGKINIHRERLDLIEVVRTCIEDLGVAFEQAGIALDLDLPNASVRVNADRTRLCQIIGNLLNNSLKFCDAGGEVNVSVRVDHAHECAVIKVTDSGIGMDAELLGRLFEPFSQGVSGLARTNGGLGLGLALVRALVALHKGQVEAHSDGPGRGSQFTIRLPLDVSDSTIQDALATVASAETAPRPPSNRILIIEDNVDAALSLAEALRLDGHEVVAVHSGREGVERAKSFMPEVVLCDVGLPQMDGYAVARAIRGDPALQGALLIAVTGYAADTDKERARSAGFDLHVAKPLEVGRLGEIFLARAKAC